MSARVFTGRTTTGVIRWQFTSFWFKRAWSDEWTWVPYVVGLHATEVANPGVAEMRFRFEFGNIKRWDRSIWDIYAPLFVQGAYVMVLVHDQWSEWPLWIGVVQFEQADLDNTEGYPQGRHEFVAYGMEHLLDRREIDGAWTDAGFIDRPVGFNKRDGFGLVRQGNRSTSVGARGVHLHSSEGELWSNLDIANYLIEYFSDAGISYEIVGATAALDQIVDEHEFYGLTLKQALDRLIERQRGLAWRLLTPTAAGGTVYIYVFSILAYEIQYEGIYLPANPDPAIVVTEGRFDKRISVRFSELERFDRIEVIGGPISVCASFSYADGTLEPGWTSAEETDYKTASSNETGEVNDTYRKADKLRNVYQKHRVPKDWDGQVGDGEGGALNNALVSATRDAGYDTGTASVFWTMEKRFEQDIPLEEQTEQTDAEIDYRRAFALIQHPDPPDATDTWLYVEKLTTSDLEAARFTVSDRELSVYVEPRINHLMALNHFSGASDSDIDPSSGGYDYETLIVTAFLKTDARLRTSIDVPGTVATETGRTKIIAVPDAEVWLIAPNTVTDVEDGELVRSPYAYTEVRNDGAYVRAVAALAAAWYGQARATVVLECEYLTPEYYVGSLILGTMGSWHATLIGTPVTMKRWDMRTCTTTISTSFDELNLVESVGMRRTGKAK